MEANSLPGHGGDVTTEHILTPPCRIRHNISLWTFPLAAQSDKPFIDIHASATTPIRPHPRFAPSLFHHMTLASARKTFIHPGRKTWDIVSLASHYAPA
jgi:hypothetical protein